MYNNIIYMKIMHIMMISICTLCIYYDNTYNNNNIYSLCMYNRGTMCNNNYDNIYKKIMIIKVCIYMCVCVYVYMCICVCIYMCVYIHNIEMLK